MGPEIFHKWQSLNNVMKHYNFNSVQSFIFRFLASVVHAFFIDCVIYSIFQPGMLELTDCLSLCLNLPTCKSINYETGLCVAFNTSALEHPGISYKNI